MCASGTSRPPPPKLSGELSSRSPYVHTELCLCIMIYRSVWRHYLETGLAPDPIAMVIRVESCMSNHVVQIVSQGLRVHNSTLINYHGNWVWAGFEIMPPGLELKAIELTYCILCHNFSVQILSRFWTRCGNSRGLKFTILLMFSLV